MKRVQLQLPEAVVDWIDRNAEDIESRASFVRRTLVQVMRGDERRLPPAAMPSAAMPAPHSRATASGKTAGHTAGGSDGAAVR